MKDDSEIVGKEHGDGYILANERLEKVLRKEHTSTQTKSVDRRKSNGNLVYCRRDLVICRV